MDLGPLPSRGISLSIIFHHEIVNRIHRRVIEKDLSNYSTQKDLRGILNDLKSNVPIKRHLQNENCSCRKKKKHICNSSTDRP